MQETGNWRYKLLCVRSENGQEWHGSLEELQEHDPTEEVVGIWKVDVSDERVPSIFTNLIMMGREVAVVRSLEDAQNWMMFYDDSRITLPTIKHPWTRADLIQARPWF